MKRSQGGDRQSTICYRLKRTRKSITYCVQPRAKLRTLIYPIPSYLIHSISRTPAKAPQQKVDDFKIKIIYFQHYLYYPPLILQYKLLNANSTNCNNSNKSNCNKTISTINNLTSFYLKHYHI